MSTSTHSKKDSTTDGTTDGATNETGSAAARLGELLEAELASIRNLEAALTAEHGALVGSDADALDAATQAKNAAIAAQQEQQAQRAAWLQDCGLPSDTPLGDAIARVGGSAEHGRLREAMVLHAQRCHEANRRNGVMIQRLQDRTRGALSILRQSDKQPDLYSTSGRREAGDDTRSLGKA